VYDKNPVICKWVKINPVPYLIGIMNYIAMHREIVRRTLISIEKPYLPPQAF
jgi:hypothetical protein